MAEESAKLRIPYIAASQAQKHVTHNEAMTLLDTLVQLSVLDKDLTAPPGSPAEGDCYIVAGGGGTATGAWTGWEKRIARFIDGGWRSYLPGQGSGAGWLAWVMDEDAMYRFDGTDWELAGIEGPAGPTGPAGAAGPAGPTGPAGASSLTICRAKTTANVNLAGGGLANGTTHDGVTLATGDRVLVTAQTAQAENGVYIVPASGAASRDTNFNTYDAHPGVYFSVMEGAANADTLWRCTSNRGGTLGTASLVFSQFQGGGGSGDVVGPASAPDNALVRFDGTTGKLIKNGGTIATADIANDAVTYAKMQNVSATDRLIGRSSAGAGDPEEIVCTAAGRALIDDADAAAQRATLSAAASGANSDITSLASLASINGGQLAGFRNLLINPYGHFNQRVASSIGDDTYGHDRWYALTQTASITVSTVTNAENGTPRMWRLTQSQASAQRMGYAQIIEGKNCIHLRGRQVTLSGRIKYSLNAAIRYAILEWTGTEDAVTSDVVNAWTNATYTAGQFFIGTNVNVLAVGAITPAAATLADLAALTATVGNSANNLIVFLWTEGTAAQNATLDGALQLEQGAVATAREHRPITIEKMLCQRYYYKTYAEGTAPGAATVNNGNDIMYPSAGTSQIRTSFYYPVPMRTTPSVTVYDVAGNANKVFRGGNGKTPVVVPDQTAVVVGTDDTTSAAEFFYHLVADAEL